MGRVRARVLACSRAPHASATLCYATTPRDAVRAHVDLYEDHEVLRRVLRERRLIAFVPDGTRAQASYCARLTSHATPRHAARARASGSVLPRAAGNTELPMTGPGVVRFASPPSLRVSIDLPHRYAVPCARRAGSLRAAAA